MIQGSSVAAEVVTSEYSRILVCLDSNHTHDHVSVELHAYVLLVTADSYCVVYDTIIKDIPADIFPDCPWGPSNNPKTAVRDYLSLTLNLRSDKRVQHKQLITVAPCGYLRRLA